MNARDNDGETAFFFFLVNLIYFVSFAGELFSPFHERESNEMVYKGIVYGVNKSSSLQGKIWGIFLLSSFPIGFDESVQMQRMVHKEPSFKRGASTQSSSTREHLEWWNDISLWFSEMYNLEVASVQQLMLYYTLFCCTKKPSLYTPTSENFSLP